MRVWDAHCHLAAGSGNNQRALQQLLDKIAKSQHTSTDSFSVNTTITQIRLSLMGTYPTTDWTEISQLATQYPDTIQPCFGWHPWFSHRLHGIESTAEQSIISINEADSQLRSLLNRHSSACVGEFGYDRAARVSAPDSTSTTNTMTSVIQLRSIFNSHQRPLFEWQFNLAAELQRPVSLHLVQSAGEFLEFCRSVNNHKVPPAIMLHSYTGSVDLLRQLILLRPIGRLLYFSFSSTINCKQFNATQWAKARTKLTEIIQAVPNDRLLVESDMDDFERTEVALLDMLGLISEAKQLSIGQAAEQTWLNAERFFDSKTSALTENVSGSTSQCG
jgi:TatD DNase family protein